MRTRTVVVVSLTLLVAGAVVVAPLASARRSREPEVSKPGSFPRDTANADLLWLARHQQPDGRWSARAGSRCPCDGPATSESEVFLTSLAVGDFFSAGYTPPCPSVVVDPFSGKGVRFGRNVKLALEWLQRRDPRNDRLRDRALAAWVLVEAYGLTAAVAYRAPASRALRALVEEAQAPFLDDELPTTLSWTLLALAAARDDPVFAELVPRATWDRVVARLRDRASDPSPRPLGLRRPSTFTPGSVASRLATVLDSSDQRVAGDVATWLVQESTRWTPGVLDVEVAWLGTEAILAAQPKERDRERRAWSSALVRAVQDWQRGRDEGCAEGSWAPSDGVSRITATALAGLNVRFGAYGYGRAHARR